MLFQERELEKYDDWNPKNLQDRRGKLVNWALERWAIPERYRGEPAAEVGDVVQDG